MTVRKIALISCSAEKLGRMAPARELYTSQLFRKSVAWVTQQGLEWFVISARHGLIKPDSQLMPYNHTMRAKSPEERAEWERGIAMSIDAYTLDDAAVEIVLLAGQAYAGWIPLVSHFASVQQPMAGMQIGQRLQWLTHAVQGVVQEDLFA